MISTKLLVFFNNKSSLVYSYDFYIVLDNRGVSKICKFKLCMKNHIFLKFVFVIMKDDCEAVICCQFKQ